MIWTQLYWLEIVSRLHQNINTGNYFFLLPIVSGILAPYDIDMVVSDMSMDIIRIYQIEI